MLFIHASKRTRCTRRPRRGARVGERGGAKDRIRTARMRIGLSPAQGRGLSAWSSGAGDSRTMTDLKALRVKVPHSPIASTSAMDGHEDLGSAPSFTLIRHADPGFW